MSERRQAPQDLPLDAPAEPGGDVTPPQRAEIERYFRETEEGRAALAQFFRDSPDGRACMEDYLNSAPQALAQLEEHFKAAPDDLARLQAHMRATPGGEAALRASIAAEVRCDQPRLLDALRVDAAVYESLMLTPLQLRGGFDLLRQVLRLAWQNDAFFAQLLYRLRVALSLRGVPILPTLLHRLCVVLSQIDIGKHVLLEPGVYIPHGKVVVDGLVRIGRGTMITPWVTLGLTNGIAGPTIGRDCLIGTGAKILGPVTVGDGARVAANAVVLSDVPAHATVAGAPAKVVRASGERATNERGGSPPV